MTFKKGEKRPRVILMSATLDVDRITSFFGSENICEVHMPNNLTWEIQETYLEDFVQEIPESDWDEVSQDPGLASVWDESDSLIELFSDKKAVSYPNVVLMPKTCSL